MLLLLTLVMAGTAIAEGALTACYNPEFPSAVVEEHEPTGDEYFADAVFIGDSMMERVETLGEIPTANFVWMVGMSPASAGRKQFRVRGSEEKLTTYEMAARYQPKKLYILLGTNGLNNFPSQTILGDYERLADDLITHFPDALIYVIAPPPMSYKRMTGENNIPAGRYRIFAEELKALAQRRHFYYIDLYHLLIDGNGYLPSQYDSGDGYHLSPRAYTIFVDAVRRQTVPYPTLTEEGE